MGRKSKKDKGPPPIIRSIVAMNVATLRDRAYTALSGDTAKNRQLAKDAGTSLSQIQRILSCELGTSIDYIEGIARALGCRPHDLLTPYFNQGSGAPPIERDEAPDHLQLRRAPGLKAFAS